MMSTVRTSQTDSDADSSEDRNTETTGQAAGAPDDHREKDALFREILANSGSGELRQIEVNVRDGQVVLSGRVSSFYQKQLAQESLLPVAIGMQICNQLEVDP
ncbi:BON domain protein [Stieleria neptunia]|uniref:BON domain protein n=1 Tax=Stieleria neptunia TaxID=2527979 RepID=A0A518HTT4_9BACT|nr:BON domain-containing protein [Stieleria neptunia]QDV44269.1 BON domain protein [Stieleria neptunia]